METANGFAIDTVNKHKRELDLLRDKIGNLSESLNKERKQLNDYTDELSRIEQEINAVAVLLRTEELSMSAKQAQIKQLQETERNQINELNKQQQLLALQLRTAYVLGKTAPLRILLDGQKSDVSNRILKYHWYMGETRIKRISAVKTVLENVRQTKENLSTEQQQLTEMMERGAKQQQELEKLKMERGTLMEAIKARINSQGEEFSRLKKNEERLATLVQSLEEAIESAPTIQDQKGNKAVALKQRKGRLPWPTKGTLSISFGEEKGSGIKWDGVYIKGIEGEIVEAVHPGRVVFADWLNGFGLLLIIDHGQGYMSLYGHNQSLLKKVGDWADIKEPISQVGSSGGNSSSGIYFGIRYKGKPLNPSDWCAKTHGKRQG